MRKVNVLIATNDSLYCEKIEEYIQEMKFPIELNIVTEKKYFVSSNEKNIVDIVLVAENFLDSMAENFFVKENVFILSSKNLSEKKYINPYQKTETFLNEILWKYGELSGESSFLVEKKTKKNLICVYSPCGGSGKTTLSFALAEYFAQSKNVLYLNFDIFSSTNFIFGETQKGGFSQVLLSLKQNAGNQFLISVSKNMKRNSKTNILYFTDLENPFDLEDIKEQELQKMLEQIIEMKDIDIVIIDLETSFTTRTKKILELSDIVILPVLDTPICQNKVRCFIEAAKTSDLLENVLKKGYWTANQSNGYLKFINFINVDFIIPEVKGLSQNIEKMGVVKNAVSNIVSKILEGCEK